MQVPSFDWTSGQFMAHTFTRSWMELFTKSNDTFGAQLIDKVWAYSNGKTSDLEMIADVSDLASMTDLFSVMPEAEALMPEAEALP